MATEVPVREWTVSLVVLTDESVGFTVYLEDDCGWSTTARGFFETVPEQSPVTMDFLENSLD